MLTERSKLIAETVPKLLRRDKHERVRKLIAPCHAVEIAFLFRKLTPHMREQLFHLVDDVETRAELFGELDPDIAKLLLPGLTNDELLLVMREMSDDDAADLLELLPTERADVLLKSLRQAGEEEVVELFEYHPETAAGIMTRDVFTLHEDDTAQDALGELQSHGDEFEMTYYLYVTNDSGHLVGVVSLRGLVLSPRETHLSEIMETDVLRVSLNTDQEEVAKIVAQYNLLAIPVVDQNNKLVGVVTVDDIIDVIRFEATEDMLKMAGAGPEFDGDAGAFRSAASRIPWLLASFVGGITAAFLVSAFEETIQKVAPLAAFIPIVLGMGGNVGIQSATIITRGIALGRIDTTALTKTVGREFLISLICGVTYGLLLGLVTFVQYGGLLFGLTVGLAVGSAMVIAATVGAAIPIVFDRLNADPALASGPFVTTTVDVLGILAYFSIAVVLLGL